MTGKTLEQLDNAALVISTWNEKFRVVALILSIRTQTKPNERSHSQSLKSVRLLSWYSTAAIVVDKNYKSSEVIGCFTPYIVGWLGPRSLDLSKCEGIKSYQD